MSESEDKSDQEAPESPSGAKDTGKTPEKKPSGGGRRGRKTSQGQSGNAQKSGGGTSAKGRNRTTADKTATGGSRGRGGRLLIVLLILLVAGATAAGGWWLHEEQQRLQERLGTLSTQEDRLQQTLDKRLEDLATELHTEQADAHQQQVNTIEALSDQLGRVEDRLGRTETDWHLLEVAHLLRLADRQMRLADDPDGAEAALRAADQRLADLDSPRYQPVREATASALQRLNATEWPDIPGLSARITGIAAIIDQLPLSHPADTGAIVAAEPVEKADGWRGVLADTLSSLQNLVVIRRHEQAVEALLPPEQTTLLRLNLHLQLETAQSALMRGDTALFRQSLERVDGWIAHYFDPEASATRSARETLGELMDAPIHESGPDLSAPLEALRTLTEDRAS